MSRMRRGNETRGQSTVPHTAHKQAAEPQSIAGPAAFLFPRY